MMNAVLNGKPETGGPHVRSDEGEHRPKKSSGGALLRRTGKMLSALVGGAAACVVGTARAETATWTAAASDAAGHSSLTNRLNWSDTASWTAGTAETGDGQPSPANDYVASKPLILRAPRITPYVFRGKSLSVGTEASKATMGVGSQGQATDLTFANDGLVLRRGIFGQFYNSQTKVRGHVTITAPDGGGDVDSQMVFTANNKLTVAGCSASLWFVDDVSGAAGTLFQCSIANTSQYPGNANATNSVFRFTGDLSGLHSTVRVSCWSNLKRNERFDKQPAWRATFSTGASAMPGALDLWRGAGLELYTADTQFTVGSLRFSGDNILEVPYDFTAGTGATVRVGQTFAASGVTTVRLVPVGTEAATAFRHAVLRAPVGTTLDAANFAVDFAGTKMPYRLEISADTDGLSTLWLVHGPVVSLGQDDGYSNKRESFCQSTLAHGWVGIPADEWPMAGKDYLTEDHTLRAPNTPSEQTFAGDSLTVRANAESPTLILRAYRTTINDLRLVSTGTKSPIISHYVVGRKNVWPYSDNGLCELDGQARVSSPTGQTGRIQFSLAIERAMKYGIELAGQAAVVYDTYLEKQDFRQSGHHWLTRVNPDLTGTVAVRYRQGYSCRKADYASFAWCPDEGITLPTMAHCTHLYFDDPLCFGGPEPSYTYNALQIEDYSILHPTKSVTFDDATRGIQICNAWTGGSAVGRFDVTNDVTLTVRQKINFTGAAATLVKEGGGTLELGAGCVPTFGTAQATAPTASDSGMLHVTAGALRAAAAHVVDGLALTLGGTARLALNAGTSDAELAATGFTPKSFALADDAAVCPIDLEKGAEAVPPRRTLGLLTLDAASAAAVRGRIAVRSPYRLYVASVVENERDDGMVTFAARFRNGFLIIVR